MDRRRFPRPPSYSSHRKRFILPGFFSGRFDGLKGHNNYQFETNKKTSELKLKQQKKPLQDVGEVRKQVQP